MYYGDRQWHSPGNIGQGEQKILSALSYIGILWIVSLILGRYDTKVRFHTNQGIILTIFEFIFRILLFILHAVINLFLVIPFSMLPPISAFGVLLNKLLTFAYWALTAIYIIIGVVNALSDRQKPLPVIGSFFSFIR